MNQWLGDVKCALNMVDNNLNSSSSLSLLHMVWCM